MAFYIGFYAYAIIVNTLLPQLLIELFETFPLQCRHIEHMHEEVWFRKKYFFDKMTAENDNLSQRPKIKFYLFPLTRPTLRKGPYPKDFISIFSQEIFFLKFIGNCKLRQLSYVNSVIFKKYSLLQIVCVFNFRLKWNVCVVPVAYLP